MVSSSRVECSISIRHANNEDVTYKLSRNVGHQTPSDVGPHPRRMGPQLYRCDSWKVRIPLFPSPKVGASLGTLLSNIFNRHSGRKTRDHVSNPYTTPTYRIHTKFIIFIYLNWHIPVGVNNSQVCVSNWHIPVGVNNSQVRVCVSNQSQTTLTLSFYSRLHVSTLIVSHHQANKGKIMYCSKMEFSPLFVTGENPHLIAVCNYSRIDTKNGVMKARNYSRNMWPWINW